MASRRGPLGVLLLASVGICACGKQMVPAAGEPINQAPTSSSQETLDFLGGIYFDPFVAAVADIDSNGFVQPFGAKNDGFGILTTVSNPRSGPIPPGLENLPVTTLQPRSEHIGGVTRDIRVADFDNDGFLDLISTTYDCVDPANPDDVARVYRNNGDGTFTEVLNPFRDSHGRPITLQGRGETIVVADFNNDGFLDIFIPYYSYQSNDPDPDGAPGTICKNSLQSYLLINDGTGHFTDVADVAGISLRNLPAGLKVEGAQAIDLNNDGLIDLYAGSHMFMNTGITNGIPHFVDRAAYFGLPPFFDEGAKFIDAYNDGLLDLVLLDPHSGPALFRFQATQFVQQPAAFPTDTYGETFGMNAYDLNNDGLEDVVINGGTNCDPKIFLNTGSGFQRASVQHRFFTLDKSDGPFARLCNGPGAVAFGDVNNDGKIDIFYTTFSKVYSFINNFKTPNPVFEVEVLGPNGEHNQQGRVVRMSPESRPDVVFTRVVDSGSGYLSQNQYPLLIGSPYSEQHVVKLSLPQTFNSNKLAQITFSISPGQRARVFAPSMASPNGRVEISPRRPFTFDPALYPAAQGILE
jgi:hypothetical protein